LTTADIVAICAKIGAPEVGTPRVDLAEEITKSQTNIRLRRYVRNPEMAVAARAEFRERVAWWQTGRAFKTRKWPAVVLMETATKNVQCR